MSDAGTNQGQRPAEAVEPIEAAWSLESADVVVAMDSDADSGLTEASVRRRATRFGANEIAVGVETPAWKRMLAQFRDPLVLLLLVAIVVSLIAWFIDGADELPIDAVVIAVIVLLNAGLGFWQESKAIDAVAALRVLTAARTTVLRDGRMTSVANVDLVPGDIVILEEGSAIGADARLLDVANLQVSEAPLTGESTVVDKTSTTLDGDTELADRTNMVFRGTAVTSGHGTAVVVATAMDTQIGRIASLIEQASEDPTPLEREIQWLGKMLGIVVVVLAAIVVAAIVLTSELSEPADVIDALLVGVSLAVAAVPEGLPAIMSVVLALGVQRMAKRNAIVKQLSSVETLGAASIICTDKTGTLTRNEMTIVRIETASGAVDVTGSGYDPHGRVVVDGRPIEDDELRTAVELVLGAGCLANNASFAQDDQGQWEVLGDPTEAAFLVAEEKLGLAERRVRRFDRVDEVPFTSERKLMSTLHHDGDFDADQPVQEQASPSELMLFTKGSPDVLLERCSHERVGGLVIELTDDRREAILASIDRLADQALRTLGVAYRPMEPSASSIDVDAEHGLVHLGIVGIVDPPREEVAAAIEEARGAGIRVIMITGDHPRTAARIGAQLGIGDGAADAVTGRELSAMTDTEFRLATESSDVFARVIPEHKLRIVEQLQQSGQVVAMTGDGVNDAPALKQADIGVAMGINGTEVSKDASNMILADDNFATILGAVREGREIFADIRKCVRYLLASNAGEVLVVFVGVLAAGWLGLGGSGDELAVPLLATQILWINLLTDSALALALGLDPAVEDVMARPARRLDERIIDRSMVTTIALIGVVSAAAGLLALDIELPGGLIDGSGTIATGRTMVFTTIVLAQIFNAFNARSDTVSAFVRPFENRLLWGAVALTVALQVFVVHVPFMNRAFDTEPLDLRRWLICIGLAATVLVADELRKVLHRRTRPALR
ncbi:MAG: HAD-IC family P-type ATPase [Aquihabitans sp.]